MRPQLGTTLALIILGCIATNATDSYTHYRLPTAIQPDLYELKVITYLEDPHNLTFQGEVAIRLNILEETSNITLHVRNLTIDDSRITVENHGSDESYHFCGADIETVPENDYYIIKLCEPLKKDEIYQVKLHFSAMLNDQLDGYYRSSYVEKDSNETRWLSVTQFEPTSARAAFPCFDEPSFKAKFVIWLGHHKSLTALSNMELEQQIPLNGTDNFVWSIFEESVPMSTYLVAYTVNDFVYKTSHAEGGSNVTFRTWFRKEAIDQCSYAAEVGPKVLKYYEDIFGVPFPLSKVDAIAIPDFSSGAMENWGLITYTEMSLLYSPGISSEYNKERVVSVIAHELAHQWFGNLVTMKWWTDLWLNEGFATYVASLGVNHVNPEWDVYNDDNLFNMLTIFQNDCNLGSHPISQPILSSNRIQERFDSISYNKGSGVLRMLHMLLGDEGFFDGVRDYLQKHKYQNAEQDDLWAAFTVMAHKYNRIEPQYNMKTIMDSWTLQSGYPLVNVSRDYSTGSLEITQQRYLQTTDVNGEEVKKCWWVPLSYTTASEYDFENTAPRAWLKCDDSGKSVTLKLDDVAADNEWIMMNMQFTGVYRVMYDTENWRLLKKTLNSDEFTKMHVMNRAQLLEDAIWLAWSGHQGYDVTFDILDYLVNERDYLPWRTALGGLSAVKSILEPLKEESEYFKAYMRHIIQPIYYHLNGLNDTTTNLSSSHSGILHKSLIASWACYLELKDCITTAINYFQEWKASINPSTVNKIPVDLRTRVYCTAIKYGNKEDWQFLWQRYKESNMASERMSMLLSLGCTLNEKMLQSFLGKVLDVKENLHKKDTMYIIIAASQNKIGFKLVWKYFVENISDLNKFYGSQSTALCELLNILANRIVSPDARKELADFIETHKELFSKCQSNIKLVLEDVNVNIKWIERRGQDLKEQLLSRLINFGVLNEDGRTYINV